ncbi:MAG: class I SAM-dependent methyltransferase [Bacteroidetes bacterium]|nr:class I SAM-dependent methyltransferase [Bacteroidota bacterium]
MKNRGWFSVMGHSKMMAIIGIVASVVILVLMPNLKWVAGLTIGVVLIHVALLLVLSLSVAVVLPDKLKIHFKGSLHRKREEQKFDAGWSVGWLNGFWVVSIVFLAAAVHIYLTFPALQLLAFFLFLLALNFFIGNLIVRSPENTRYLVLPAVRLADGQNGHILDAGCGAGRTTIALSRTYSGKITAFDLFDADYIAGGGNTLLEKNLKLAGIQEQVEIVQGDITRTGFPGGTFQAVVSSYMIDHLGGQKLNALREISRILRPGGRMLMIVLTPTLSSFGLLNLLSFFLTSKKAWKKLFASCGFRLVEDGQVNGGTYFLVEK